MGHSHHKTHSAESNVKVAFFLNVAFSVVELIGGLLTNSVAILSNALHDLGDSLTLGISWYFLKISHKKVTREYSYGFKRFSVLGALINAIVLITGSFLILDEAIPRLIDPVNPKTEEMIYFAIGGIIINGIAAARLKNGKSINEKAVYLHLLEDVLGWVAVLVGAIVMHLTYLPIIDPLLSVLISLFILFNSYKNLKEGFRIILQGTPPSIDIHRVHETFANMPEVESFHDCHTWTMDGEYHVLSVHLVLRENKTLYDLRKVKSKIKNELVLMGINHTTIELETADEKGHSY
ncbi:MAG: cation diffusion facilitator family transporter [Bacteroidota bacterium]